MRSKFPRHFRARRLRCYAVVSRLRAPTRELHARNADRPDCDPDVVAARGADGCDRTHAAVSAGGDHLRDRRLRRSADLDRAQAKVARAAAAAGRLARRRRRAVRLSRAVFSVVAARAAGGGGPRQLSLAAADRAVLRVPSRRTARAASHHRRAARARRHGAAVSGPRRVGIRMAICAGISGRVHRGLRLGDLFGGLAAACACADRCGGGLLRGNGAARRCVPSDAGDDRLARDCWRNGWRCWRSASVRWALRSMPGTSA